MVFNAEEALPLGVDHLGVSPHNSFSLAFAFVI